MKKTGILLTLLVMLLLLGGCTKKADEENEYTVYYVNTAGTRLTESKYTPTAANFDELMAELLDKLKQAPSGEASAFKSGVTVEGYERGIDALRIDFSQSYYDLSNTDEVLLRAAIVKTFSQIPGVAKVMITVGSEQLRDAEGQPVPAMDASSFIDTKEGGINSYLYAKLSLYFPDASGKMLEQETRTLHYSSKCKQIQAGLRLNIAGHVNHKRNSEHHKRHKQPLFPLIPDVPVIAFFYFFHPALLCTFYFFLCTFLIVFFLPEARRVSFRPERASPRRLSAPLL